MGGLGLGDFELCPTDAWPPQFVDADNLLVNPDTLRLLIAENKTVVAPMLDSRAAYSNFWCGMTSQVGHFRVQVVAPGALPGQAGACPCILLSQEVSQARLRSST